MKSPTVVNKYKCNFNPNTNSFDLYIGRGSKWSNPFVIGVDGDRTEVIEKFRNYLIHESKLLNSLYELEGKRLGCLCKPQTCHGDVLVEEFNYEFNHSK